jgi:hypothetical protein
VEVWERVPEWEVEGLRDCVRLPVPVALVAAVPVATLLEAVVVGDTVVEGQALEEGERVGVRVGLAVREAQEEALGQALEEGVREVRGEVEGEGDRVTLGVVVTDCEGVAEREGERVSDRLAVLLALPLVQAVVEREGVAEVL